MQTTVHTWHYYEDGQMRDDRADEIAPEYAFTEVTAGEVLRGDPSGPSG